MDQLLPGLKGTFSARALSRQEAVKDCRGAHT